MKSIFRGCHEVLIASLVSVLLIRFTGSQSCPADTDYVHRLGQTRFYVLHKEGDSQSFVTWHEASGECAKYGMKLAKILNVGQEASFGRYLEQLAGKWQHTWYWINAKYDYSRQTYVWGDNEQPIRYSNFFYRQPRPVGVGGYFPDVTGATYNNSRNSSQCIALALPWDINSVYGHQLTWDERPCESRNKRNVLCEANKTCDNEADSSDILNEHTFYYLGIGNFLFGNRRYVVNWASRTNTEAEQYCAVRGLQLYKPREGDACLLPYLKLWARRVTSAHFWTDLRYISTIQQFQYKNGTPVAPGNSQFNYTGDAIGQQRSSKYDDKFCVSLAYNFEFRNETACQSCQWSFMTLVPANCNNAVGTICEHSDAPQRSCSFKGSRDFKDPSEVIRQTAVTHFAFRGSGYYRSTYKQQFGSRLCPSGTRMVRRSDKNWQQIDVLKAQAASINRIFYSYDFEEYYWAVDTDGFDKPPGRRCIVSFVVPATGVREDRNATCDQWHFYLCAQDKF